MHNLPIQLDFFRSDEECEMIALRDELTKTKASLDKVRKGTYARLNEQQKQITALHEDMELLKRNICRGQV